MTRDVLARCSALGFAAAGIAPAAPSRWAAEVRAWLAAGSHGEMDFLLDDLDTRLDPTRLLRGTRSFVMVADLYAGRVERSSASGPTPDPRRRDAQHDSATEFGRIARYARGRDYHDTIKRRLHALADQLRIDYPGSEFRSFVDTAPVLERELAVAAGLGWQAKNTMLIHPTLGSYLLLGGMATTLPLTPAGERTPDHCGTCTRCIDACPTAAITPYRVEATRCVSYLTIEHRSLIPPPLHAGLGDWVFGCDVCQDVCPHNSPREGAVALPNAAYEPRTTALPLADVLGWTPIDRERAFATSAMKRATIGAMKRNALIAAGNALRRGPNAALAERIGAIADDPSEPDAVRTTARAVLERVRSADRQ